MWNTSPPMRAVVVVLLPLVCTAHLYKHPGYRHHAVKQPYLVNSKRNYVYSKPNNAYIKPNYVYNRPNYFYKPVVPAARPVVRVKRVVLRTCILSTLDVLYTIRPQTCCDSGLYSNVCCMGSLTINGGQTIRTCRCSPIIGCGKIPTPSKNTTSTTTTTARPTKKTTSATNIGVTLRTCRLNTLDVLYTIRPQTCCNNVVTNVCCMGSLPTNSGQTTRTCRCSPIIGCGNIPTPSKNTTSTTTTTARPTKTTTSATNNIGSLRTCRLNTLDVLYTIRPQTCCNNVVTNVCCIGSLTNGKQTIRTCRCSPIIGCGIIPTPSKNTTSAITTTTTTSGTTTTAGVTTTTTKARPTATSGAKTTTTGATTTTTEAKTTTTGATTTTSEAKTTTTGATTTTSGATTTTTGTTTTITGATTTTGAKTATTTGTTKNAGTTTAIGTTTATTTGTTTTIGAISTSSAETTTTNSISELTSSPDSSSLDTTTSSDNEESSTTSSAPTSPSSTESLCASGYRLLNGNTVLNECTYPGVARSELLTPAVPEYPVMCNLVYTTATVDGVFKNTFLTHQYCTSVMERILNTGNTNMALDLEIGTQSYPINTDTFQITDGPDGAAFLTVHDRYVNILTDLGPCQTTACGYDNETMNGLVDLTDCKMVSYGSTDLDASQDGLNEAAVEISPEGCGSIPDVYGTANSMCFTSTSGLPLSCTADHGAPVYCVAPSNGEEILMGIVAFTNTCGQGGDIKVVPYPG